MHVCNESPPARDRAGGRAFLAAAATAGLRVGCAPDTFLGPGLQTARRLIDEGLIGEPQTALAILQGPGPDAWHPNPAFLFQAGAGPLFDLGPYYLTALIQVLGPVRSVAALASIARPRRTIGSGPRAGETFDVTVPSHVGALVQFAAGASAQATFSFDSPLPRIALEVTGREATMILPDPNEFDGEIRVRRRGAREDEVVTRTEANGTRGIGVLDLARAIRADRPHRATGALAAHVLDVMTAIGESADAAAFVRVESTVEVPPLLPDGWDPFTATGTSVPAPASR
jgi:predicted dehydrogenase